MRSSSLGHAYRSTTGFSRIPSEESETWLLCRRCVTGSWRPTSRLAAAHEVVDALPAGLARLEVIEGAGHFTWKDAPDRYWPMLADFVTGR